MADDRELDDFWKDLVARQHENARRLARIKWLLFGVMVANTISAGLALLQIFYFRK